VPFIPLSELISGVLGVGTMASIGPAGVSTCMAGLVVGGKAAFEAFIVLVSIVPASPERSMPSTVEVLSV
jgi:hypothetical protein